jgi:hypothetical protein
MIVRLGRRGYLLPEVENLQEVCDLLQSTYGLRVNKNHNKFSLRGKEIGPNEKLSAGGDTLKIEMREALKQNPKSKKRQKKGIMLWVPYVIMRYVLQD